MIIHYFNHILQIETDEHCIPSAYPTRTELFAQWKSDHPISIQLTFPDLSSRDQWLNENFVNIHAAGGLVFNNTEQMLFIFRRGKWDLPKGKMEPGESPQETAVREIEEETGATGLSLIKPITQTFHLYEEKNEVVLKTSHWFLIHCQQSENLKPQLEEDITEIQWFAANELHIPLSNTFANIQQVIQAYLNDSAKS
jgi:8-oxo-dGTP pyrophosphatase MutT (NUDIX family)